jgi:hypothetical protein
MPEVAPRLKRSLAAAEGYWTSAGTWLYAERADAAHENNLFGGEGLSVQEGGVRFAQQLAQNLSSG